MFFLCQNLFQKYKNLGQKITILSKLRGNIKLLSTYNLLCRKFAAVFQKIATFFIFLLPANFS